MTQGPRPRAGGSGRQFPTRACACKCMLVNIQNHVSGAELRTVQPAYACLAFQPPQQGVSPSSQEPRLDLKMVHNQLL